MFNISDTFEGTEADLDSMKDNDQTITSNTNDKVQKELNILKNVVVIQPMVWFFYAFVVD